MSEPIPESIPTSQDPRSKRPLKKRALTPVSAQAATLSALFSKPDQEIRIPSTTTATKPSSANAPPEIVANVQGSSAGAGSGEFHVYKASRRREYERLRAMDEEVRGEREAEEFERAKREREERDRERTRRNREKRGKMKARKGKGKGGVGAGGGDSGDVKEERVGGRGIKGPRVDGGAAEDGQDKVDEEGQAEETTQEAGLIIHDDD
jgi:hypothetical protein